MDFGNAFQYLIGGEKIHRSGWNGKGMYILSMPQWVPGSDYQNAAVRPFIVIVDAEGYMVPWAPSQTDIFAVDWAVLK